MKKHTIIVIALITCLCSGCFETVKYITKVTVPNEYLLDSVEAVPPPEVSKYVAANDVQKEKMLTDALLGNYKAIAEANLRFAALRDWRLNMLEKEKEDNK